LRVKVININHGHSIDKGILKEFLEENQLEVGRMLFNEWNWNDYKKVVREEAAAEFAERERQFQEQTQQFQEQLFAKDAQIRRLRGV
jgi:hypothetical protein